MIEEIRSTDKTIIEKVIFKYPEMVSEGAEGKIRYAYNKILSLEARLDELRDNVREIEALLEKDKQEFKEITANCEIVYGTKVKEFVTDDFYASFENTGDAYQRVFKR